MDKDKPGRVEIITRPVIEGDRTHAVKVFYPRWRWKRSGWFFKEELVQDGELIQWARLAEDGGLEMGSSIQWVNPDLAVRLAALAWDHEQNRYVQYFGTWD